MQNIKEIKIETINGTETHIIIDRGNGEYTSMPKAVWEEQQKAAEESGTL